RSIVHTLPHYVSRLVVDPVRFFFSSRRRHTRSKRDWSSDVCSSDLTHDTAPYREFLNTAIEEAREETAVEVAKVLKSQLDKLDRSEERRVGKECRCRGAREE